MSYIYFDSVSCMLTLTYLVPEYTRLRHLRLKQKTNNQTNKQNLLSTVDSKQQKETFVVYGTLLKWFSQIWL